MLILIVDDSRSAQVMIVRCLREIGLAAAQMMTAASGTEALRMIAETKPDIVLCDVTIPGMSGLTLLTMVRAKGIKIPFGYVTSDGSASTRAAAQKGGAAFFITKPFTTDDFRRALAPLRLGDEK